MINDRLFSVEFIDKSKFEAIYNEGNEKTE